MGVTLQEVAISAIVNRRLSYMRCALLIRSEVIFGLRPPVRPRARAAASASSCSCGPWSAVLTRAYPILCPTVALYRKVTCGPAILRVRAIAGDHATEPVRRRTHDFARGRPAGTSKQRL